MPHSHAGCISPHAHALVASDHPHFRTAHLVSGDRRRITAFHAAGMDENMFRRIHSKAEKMAKLEPERADYWHGYHRGLLRARFGNHFGSDAEHELWLGLADSLERRWADLGRGYQDGLTAGLV
jgi:hypothetical protein